MKVTSFIDILQCLHSIPSFSSYFSKGNKVINIIENNKNTDDNKYIITEEFQSTYNNCDPINFN